MLAAAVVVRVAAWWVWSRWPGGDTAIVDAAWHDELARAWLAGTASPKPWTVAPGVAVLLAVGHVVGLGQPIAQAGLQAAWGVGAVMAVWALGRRLGGPENGVVTGAAAGWLAALCGPVVFQDLSLLGVSPAIAALAGAMLLALRPGWRAALLAGVLLGLGAWLRPNFLLMAPVLGLVAGRRLPLVALGVALALAPATIRNKVVGEEWVLLSANGGYNLAYAHPPGLTSNLPHYVDRPLNLGEIGDVSWQMASEGLGHPATVVEADRWWRGEALRRIGEDRVGFFRRTLQRAALVVSALDVQDHRAWHAHRRDRFGWLPDPSLLLPGLAAWGLWVGRKRRDVQLTALLLVAGVASLALFLVVDRYRLPLYALLLPLAGLGLADLRRAAIPVVVGVGLLASVEPFRGELLLPPLLAEPLGLRSTLDAEGRVREVDELASVAVAFAREGRPSDALRYYTEALELDPGHPRLTMQAASAALAAGQPMRAATWLGEARRLHPKDAELAFVACGVLLRVPEQARVARSTCEAARTLAPTNAAAWWQAGLARWQLGLRDQAEEAMGQAMRLDPTLPGGAEGLAQLRAERARQAASPAR